MKWQYSFIIIFIASSFVINTLATELNGRVNIINNDGNNFKVMLQINTDNDAQKFGGATIVIDYDSTLLSFPHNPESGSDFIFSNFNMGFYDTAKVTKVANGRIWINIDLTTDGQGTIVQKGPDTWTDLVLLNFVSNQIIPGNVISWGINDKFWHIYDSDNSTTWDKGNFDNVTNTEGNKSQTGGEFSYSLSQNYPNPFNPTTTIQYYMPERSLIRLVVYNTIGQEVAVLADGEKEAGTYSVNFNASSLPSGIYFYRIQAGKFIETKKMILLK